MAKRKQPKVTGVFYRCEPEVRAALNEAARTLKTSQNSLLDRLVRGFLSLPEPADVAVAAKFGKGS